MNKHRRRTAKARRKAARHQTPPTETARIVFDPKRDVFVQAPVTWPDDVANLPVSIGEKM